MTTDTHSIDHQDTSQPGAMAQCGPGHDDYWHALIREDEAAKFCDLTVRTMQALRQRGGGPKFVRLSSRCLRYRRCDLRAWANERLRTSTAEADAAA